ncbi:MAG: hypothetical protein HON78_05740 [Legionellales bacterium]|jgi:mevalonate kinase|nr:hypothetical protein [Legionellales bacterium]
MSSVFEFSTSCCAKTFFLGEYSALSTKKAILILTEPSFHAVFSLGGLREDIKTSPPCEKLIDSNLCLQNLSYKFIDPYNGRGGLGASSAEFLFWLRAASFFSGTPYDFKKKDEIDIMLNVYEKNSWSGVGSPPSGLDLVSQNYSGIVYLDLHSSKVETMRWPFKTAGFCLAHTNKKLATHSHLEGIRKPENMAFLANYVDSAWGSLLQKDLSRLAMAINGFFNSQKDLGLVAGHTADIVDGAMESGIFLAAKGCGAMGSDVVMFLYEAKQNIEAVNFIQQLGLDILATEKNMR